MITVMASVNAKHLEGETHRGEHAFECCVDCHSTAEGVLWCTAECSYGEQSSAVD